MTQQIDFVSLFWLGIGLQVLALAYFFLAIRENSMVRIGQAVLAGAPGLAIAFGYLNQTAIPY